MLLQMPNPNTISLSPTDIIKQQLVATVSKRMATQSDNTTVSQHFAIAILSVNITM